MNGVIWIFFCLYVYYVQSRYIFFSTFTENWYVAQTKCKRDYNGFLANVDLIRSVAHFNATRKCITGGQTLWLGIFNYTTKYIVYQGCYHAPASFEHDHVYSDDMSIVKCQRMCNWKGGFAIKGNVCKCIQSSSEIRSIYRIRQPGNCNFHCSTTNCGFNGGNYTVSLYTQDPDRPNRLSNQCIKIICRKLHRQFEVRYKGTPCDHVTGVSAYCVNGLKKSNVSSWREAVEFCATNDSILIESFKSARCGSGLKVWSNKRRYTDILRLNDETVTFIKSLQCGFTDVWDWGAKYIFTTHCYDKKTFACISDSTDGTSNAICQIDLNILEKETTSIKETSMDITSQPNLHTTENERLAGKDPLLGSTSSIPDFHAMRSTSTSMKNETNYENVTTKITSTKELIIGLVTTLVLCALVGSGIAILYRKRYRWNFLRCKDNEMSKKTNTGNDSKRKTTLTKDTADSYQLDKIGHCKHHTGNKLSYDVSKRTTQSEPVCANDVDTGDHPVSAHGLYSVLQKPTEDHYNVIDSDTEASFNANDVNSGENSVSANDFYFILENSTENHYNVADIDTETSTNEYHVTKSETDYDHLHQPRKKMNDDVIENDYSHCMAASDDYDYSTPRRETTQLPEDDYSHIPPSIGADIHECSND